MEDIHKIRRDYTRDSLSLEDLAGDPLNQFRHWLQSAVDAEELEPNAMCLASVNDAGVPSTRVVLLKDLSSKGLTFFTNLESRKASDIAANERVSVNFLWLKLQRQVNIKGTAGRISTAETLKYFISRPLASQLGAWSSPQSKVISSRQVLENAWQQMKDKYADGEVPVPPHWGGYRIVPDEYEFWQGRSSRLHDRFRYQSSGNGDWTVSRLAP